MTVSETTSSTPPGERIAALELLSEPDYLHTWALALRKGEHIVYAGCQDCPYARLLAAHGYTARVYAIDVDILGSDSGQREARYTVGGRPSQIIREIDALSNARASDLRRARARATKNCLLATEVPEDRYITREELLTILAGTD